MNKPLCSILKVRIENLPFMDVVAGLVQTIEEEEFTDDNPTGKPVINRFPASYDVIRGDKCTGPIKDLIPDSTKKSITYFEDFGSVFTGTNGGLIGYNSRVRLICWLNRALLTGNDYTEITAACITGLIEKLQGRRFASVGEFIQLNVKPVQIQPQNKALFANYTYDQTQRQYLMPPFEFFGIDLLCSYKISPKCLDKINFNIEKLC